VRFYVASEGRHRSFGRTGHQHDPLDDHVRSRTGRSTSVTRGRSPISTRRRHGHRQQALLGRTLTRRAPPRELQSQFGNVGEAEGTTLRRPHRRPRDKHGPIAARVLTRCVVGEAFLISAAMRRSITVPALLHGGAARCRPARAAQAKLGRISRGHEPTAAAVRVRPKQRKRRTRASRYGTFGGGTVDSA